MRQISELQRVKQLELRQVFEVIDAGVKGGAVRKATAMAIKDCIIGGKTENWSLLFPQTP